MKMITIKMPKWISNIILKFMKKKLAFFIAVLYKIYSKSYYFAFFYKVILKSIKEILKNNIAFRKNLHDIKPLIIVEFTVIFK